MVEKQANPHIFIKGEPASVVQLMYSMWELRSIY